MPRARLSALAAALALGALTLAGCGSSGLSTTTATGGPSASSATAATAAAKSAAAAAKAAESKAPKGASPTLRQIYRQFPQPKANPALKRSGAAIKAGERACAGKTPLQVKEEFFSAAKGNLSPEQAKMIATVGSYEKRVSKDASFAAGQLAADVYQATLPASTGQFGYQGCVYSLARRLEHKLAPQKR